MKKIVNIIVIITIVILSICVFTLLGIFIWKYIEDNNQNNITYNENFEEINGQYTLNFLGKETDFLIEGYVAVSAKEDYIFFQDTTFTVLNISGKEISFEVSDGFYYINPDYSNAVYQEYWRFHNWTFQYSDFENDLYIQLYSETSIIFQVPSWFSYYEQTIYYFAIFYLTGYFIIEIQDMNNSYFPEIDFTYFIVEGTRLEIRNEEIVLNSDFIIQEV